MAYSYDAGTTTPTLTGLLEIPGVLRINDGTFKSSKLPFEDSPPVRVTATPYPSIHGGTLGPAFFDIWSASIQGWLYVTSSPYDDAAAEDQLRQAFSASKGVQTVQARMQGWATDRQYGIQTAGSIAFTPRHTYRRVPTRDFVIPVDVPDPIGYDITQQTLDVPMTNVNTAVTSNGSEDVPFTAAFVGPFTDAVLTRVADGAAIEILGSFTAGQVVTVSTFGPITATRDDGSNQFGQINNRTGDRIRPGTENWTASAASGTTAASKVTFTWRDGWA